MPKSLEAIFQRANDSGPGPCYFPEPDQNKLPVDPYFLSVRSLRTETKLNNEDHELYLERLREMLKKGEITKDEFNKCKRVY